MFSTISYGFSQAVQDHDTAGTDTFATDTLVADSAVYEATDSISMYPDSVVTDTIDIERPEEVLEFPVHYKSKDSLIISVTEKRIYLYNDAEVTYDDLELKSAFVEFDMTNEEVMAEGLPDSTGNMAGLPHFTQGGEEFDADQLRYNFKSKKGIIQNVMTPQEGGYLHSRITKKHDNGHIHIKGGKYTTCDKKHPHFYLGLTKAISVPNDKIVTGPSYVVLEDIPLPIGIPFGFFPNTRTSTSGFIIPTYGEEQTRGFYLTQGGYYFAINDYVDLRITGDIYTRGTWGARASSNYRKRYKFSGNFSGSYYENITGEKGAPDYSTSKDYSINWSHNQDGKAHPTRNFGANVNMSSTSYDKNHERSISNYLTNTKRSSISYSNTFFNRFSLTAGMTHSQNSINKSVTLGLPDMSLNMKQPIYPFKKKKSSGKEKWYEDFQLNYRAKLNNTIETYDSLMFTPAMFDNMKSGFTHSMPFSRPINFLRFFTFTPSVNYQGMIHTKSITRKYYDTAYYDAELDSTYGKLIVEYDEGLKYAHGYYPQMGLKFTPKIYGMYQFKNSRVQAMRHVMSPSVSCSYVPDMGDLMPDYYRTDTIQGKAQRYSIFEESPVGTPNRSKESASVNFNLNNNFEFKVKSKNDTVDEVKKLKILENLDFSTSYNPFAETYQWSPITYNTGTRLFNNKLNIRVNGNFDLYAYDDSTKQKIDKFLWEKEKKLLRLTSTRVSFSTEFRSKKADAKQKGKEAGAEPSRQTPEPEEEQFGYPEEYVDFDIPWSIKVGVNLNYSKPADKGTITQNAISLDGDISITPKWKIGWHTGYDAIKKEFTTTSINIFRDLHCWQMTFTVVPFGYRQSYSFKINVKSSILQDLKYQKSKSWYDRM